MTANTSFRADQSVERIHQRPSDVVRALNFDVIDVEEDDEHVLRGGFCAACRPASTLPGSAAQVLRQIALDEHAFELLDVLDAPPSTISKSSWRRSVTGAPSLVG